jgi:hypothetical protein
MRVEEGGPRLQPVMSGREMDPGRVAKDFDDPSKVRDNAPDSYQDSRRTKEEL